MATIKVKGRKTIDQIAPAQPNVTYNPEIAKPIPKRVKPKVKYPPLCRKSDFDKESMKRSRKVHTYNLKHVYRG